MVGEDHFGGNQRVWGLWANSGNEEIAGLSIEQATMEGLCGSHISATVVHFAARNGFPPLV